MVKKLVSAAIGAGLVLATIAPAAFAANQCANQTTGPSSLNHCTRTLTKTKSVTLNNTGAVSHYLTSNTNTGYNAANNNTNGGGVAAGIASGLLFKQASLNTGNITVAQSDPSVEDQGLNDTTGPSSNNTVTFSTTKTLTFNMENSGTITQNATVNVVSGYNSSSNNTVGGMVTTGNASSDTSIISAMNDFIISLSQ